MEKRDLRKSKHYTKLVTQIVDYVNKMDAFRALANGRAGIVYNLLEDCKEALEPLGYSKESIESLRPIIDSAVYDKWGPDL
jgi:hypothetical protein